MDILVYLLWIEKSMIVNPRPILLEFKTFRMRGHEEADKICSARINGSMGTERSSENRAILKENKILTNEFDEVAKS
jgi:2-oxoisovalerate dehydrogenase E1 component